MLCAAVILLVLLTLLVGYKKGQLKVNSATLQGAYTWVLISLSLATETVGG